MRTGEVGVPTQRDLLLAMHSIGSRCCVSIDQTCLPILVKQAHKWLKWFHQTKANMSK